MARPRHWLSTLRPPDCSGHDARLAEDFDGTILLVRNTDRLLVFRHGAVRGLWPGQGQRGNLGRRRKEKKRRRKGEKKRGRRGRSSFSLTEKSKVKNQRGHSLFPRNPATRCPTHCAVAVVQQGS